MAPWIVAALAFATTQSWTTPQPPPSRIVGGERVEHGEFDGVVAVVAGEDLCTGTLVAEGLVITAAHCLLSATDASQIVIFNGVDLSTSPHVIASGFGSHPDFEIEATRDAFDYGFVTFSGELGATPIPPVVDQEEWDAMESGLSADEAIMLVGYGLDPADTSASMGLGIKRVVRTNVGRFTSTGIEFLAGGNGKDSCQGDSGGPALAFNAQGELRLLGVTARGSDPCGRGGFYGVPYYALPWIAEETGTNLCGDDCGSCDCLDTSPPPSDDGCGNCQAGDAPLGWAWASAGLLLLGLRRRRR